MIMNSYQLFNIGAWEHAKPEGIEFTHVYYTKKSQEVRKVKGTITVMKKVFRMEKGKRFQERKKFSGMALEDVM